MNQIYFVYELPLDRERRKLAESRGIPYPSVQASVDPSYQRALEIMQAKDAEACLEDFT